MAGQTSEHDARSIARGGPDKLPRSRPKVSSFRLRRDEGSDGMSMQAVEATSEQSTDIAMTVVVTMRQMGVLGLPRNYEIFYEALTGSNHELSVDLVSLGNRPKQEELDQIGHKYFAQNHGHGIVDGARETISRQLEEVTRILLNERNYLEKYSRILDQTAEGLNNRQLINKDILQKIVGVMSTATSSTIDHGRQAVSYARRQVDGARKRQVEARGIQAARRHRSADAYLEPPRVRPAHLQDLRFAQERDVQRADPRRHRPLQGNQRPLRPSGRRQDHPDHRRDPAVQQPRRHVRGAHRRRGIRADRRRRQRRGDLRLRRPPARRHRARRRSPTARPASTTGRSPFRWASAWRARPTGPRTSMPRPTARSTAPRSTAATR